MDIDRPNPRPSSIEPEVATKLRILQAASFAALPDATWEALLALGRIEAYPRRHRLTDQGEPLRSLVVLGGGRVKLERITAERVFPLGHRGPGQLVGETALGGMNGAAAATEHAVVVDEVTAVALPMTGLRKLLLADLALHAAMSAALLAQQREAERRLSSLLLQGVEARLSSFLLDAAARWGNPSERGLLVTVAFTHAEIALLIGSTRETVTLLLGKLKRAGLIDVDRRRVILRDHDALGRHVERR